MHACEQPNYEHYVARRHVRCSDYALASYAQSQTVPSGGLDVPARNLPVPTTVNPQIQKLIGAPLRTNWNVLPATGAEWKPVAEAGAAGTIKALPGLLERMGFKVEKTTIDGVRAFGS